MTKLPHDPWPTLAYQAKKIQIIAVGAGGIGSWVIPHLAWLVWSFNRTWNRAIEPRHASLLIVDFDLVEAKNVNSGQHFCPPEIGKPKALVIYNRSKLAYSMRHDEIAVQVAPFARSMLQHDDDERLTILVGCVDSSEGREMMARCLPSGGATPSRVWWVNANNEDSWGQVYCGNTGRLRDLQGCLHNEVCPRVPAPSLIAPILIEKEPLAQTTRRLRCGDVTMGGEQSHAINVCMAALVYGYVDPLLNGLPIQSFASYVNLRHFSIQSELITPEGLCRALSTSEKLIPFFTMDPNALLREPLAALI